MKKTIAYFFITSLVLFAGKSQAVKLGSWTLTYLYGDKVYISELAVEEEEMAEIEKEVEKLTAILEVPEPKATTFTIAEEDIHFAFDEFNPELYDFDIFIKNLDKDFSINFTVHEEYIQFFSSKDFVFKQKQPNPAQFIDLLNVDISDNGFENIDSETYQFQTPQPIPKNEDEHFFWRKHI